MLRVLNHELGADFDTAEFEHRAFYDRTAHWIEMHLVARSPQQVSIPGIGIVPFAQGETLRTEISAKYDEASVARAVPGRGPAARGLAQRRRPAVRPGGRIAGVTRTSVRALAADLAERIFAAPASASLTPRRVGAEVELIPVGRVDRPAGGHRGRPGRDAAVPSPLRRPRLVARDADRQGHALLRAAGRRHAHLRAGRPARVQLPAVPLAEPAPGPAARHDRAAPRGGRERGDRPAHRRSGSGQFAGAGAAAAAQPALRPDGRVPGQREPARRPDDAADRRVPDRSGPRR